MNLEIKTLADRLQDWIERLQNTVSVLRELEDTDVMPKGTVVLPSAPAAKPSPPRRPRKTKGVGTAEGTAGSKTCAKCGKTKTLDRFTKNKLCRDGYTNECKECAAARAKKDYQKRQGASQNSSPEKLELKHRCEQCHAAFRNLYSLTEHIKLRHPA